MNSTNDSQLSPLKPKSLSDLYKSQLGRTSASTAESNTEESNKADFSKEAINDRTEFSREALYQIINQFLDAKPELFAIADQLTSNSGKDALKAVGDGDDRFLKDHPASRDLLEVIVRTDGSRPSFMIQGGRLNKETSPAGIWPSILDPARNQLEHAIACVGRINDGNGNHVGTGFLVQQNLILTNRHVLQAIASQATNRTWNLDSDVHINFGHEYRSRQSLFPKKLTKVLFCGDKFIDRYKVDHAKLDLALIQLESAVDVPCLNILDDTDWAQSNQVVYTVGYAGNPGMRGLQTYGHLLEQLFESTFGCKRLAPGEVIAANGTLTPWSFAHDSTTLGGNSGSVILAHGKDLTAAGLHYGGTLESPRENWAHILSNTLDSTDGFSSQTLRECFNKNEVNIV